MARPLIQEIPLGISPEELVERLLDSPGEPPAFQDGRGVVLLRSGLFESPQARYSFVAAQPFLTFRSAGSRCELKWEGGARTQFGNPWRLLEDLMARYELLDELDLPFPLGACIGYWGYDLKNFVEPRLSRRAVNDLELPDCHVGLYSSLVAFDHRLGKCWILATGLHRDGSRSEERSRREVVFWLEHLQARPGREVEPGRDHSSADAFSSWPNPEENASPPGGNEPPALSSNLSRAEFVSRVEQAQRYIRSGDIYQVNLSQRLKARRDGSSWELFQKLSGVSPAPFSAYMDCGDFQIVSSSPELFLRLSGRAAQTRPIKGTRPRASDATRDAQLAYELRTSGKELAELVMITDLLRNDLGRVCEFGSVQVRELAQLERFPQVQHLVSTVDGRLRPEMTHLGTLAACFPGGSITGAPKVRAMEIIDELEPTGRGPYTGTLGYLGFNRESQMSIIIRAAICLRDYVYFNVGAGIVADSVPAAEYEETLAKARGFAEALRSSKKETRLLVIKESPTARKTDPDQT